MRVQLALNVADLESAVDFYARVFGVEPHKREPGYVNFEIEAPPLKLVLFEAPDAWMESRTSGSSFAASRPWSRWWRTCARAVRRHPPIRLSWRRWSPAKKKAERGAGGAGVPR